MTNMLNKTIEIIDFETIILFSVVNLKDVQQTNIMFVYTHGYCAYEYGSRQGMTDTIF